MSLPHVTITLTRYAEPDWLVLETLQSLAKQVDIEAHVLFLDQKKDSTIDIQALSSENIDFQRIVIPARSLSYARNEAIRRAEDDLILYIDSDAIAHPEWAKYLAEALVRNDVGIVGGRILLRWHKKPLLISKARVVREQYSGLDLGMELTEANKIVGASFGINRALLGKEAYFDESLGRRPGVLLGGEESDLCRRAIEIPVRVLYQGKALVHHQVLPERIRYRWILRRIYYAGIGRAAVGGAPGSTHKMNIWDYLVLPIILPFYGMGYLRQRLSQD